LPKTEGPNPGDGKDIPSDGKKGNGASAIFVARNRLAALDKTAQVGSRIVGGVTIKLTLQSIEIRDLSNNLTKSVKCPVQTNDIFYGGTASLLLATANSVVLFDIQQQKTLAEVTTPAVKYVIWSADGNMVALLSKHSELDACSP
jgi:coatomer protein complex subunit alpha (xenin)